MDKVQEMEAIDVIQRMKLKGDPTFENEQLKRSTNNEKNDNISAKFVDDVFSFDFKSRSNRLLMPKITTSRSKQDITNNFL